MSGRYEGYLSAWQRCERVTMPTSYWIRVAIRIQTGIPSQIEQFGYVDRMVTEEAYALIEAVVSGQGRYRRHPIAIECDEAGIVNLLVIGR